MQIWPDTEGAFDETQGEEGQGELWISAHDLGFVSGILSKTTLLSSLTSLLHSPTQAWPTMDPSGALATCSATRN